MVGMEDNDSATRRKNTGKPGNKGKFDGKANSQPESVLEQEPAGYSDIHLTLTRKLAQGDPWRRDPERVGRAGLAVIPGVIGNPLVDKLIQNVGAADALERILTLNPDMPGLTESEIAELVAATSFAAGSTGADVIASNLVAARKLGAEIATPDDDDWPAGFAALGDTKPLMLWTKGDLSVLTDPEKNVVVDGARAATGYGEHITMHLCGDLADSGRTIVSSASFGVAGMALRGAIADGGKVAVISASGFSNLVPAGHRPLIERVSEEGVLVSEYPPNSGPSKQRMNRRGKLLAAIGNRVVITEGSIRSSSLATARFAHELGRSVGAFPGPVTNVQSYGPNQLIAEGTAKLVIDADGVRALG